ncbi:MAG: hypothetical protein GX620_10370 [Chloroflexi bacterium]|nr:hypothetical protein [Chloroflexota bacterium]
MSEMGVHPFDLQSRAELAIHGLTALVDPARNGLLYFLADWRAVPPRASHGLWDCGDGSGRHTDALALARCMVRADSDAGQRTPAEEQLEGWMLRLIGSDGLSWLPSEPWAEPWGKEYLLSGTRPEEQYAEVSWAQRGTLMGLITRYQISGDEQYVERARGLVDGLIKIAVSHVDGRFFPEGYYSSGGWHSCQGRTYAGLEETNAAIVAPLVRLYEVAGYEPALDLAESLVRYTLKHTQGYTPDGALVAPLGGWLQEHFHTRSSFIMGVLKVGLAAQRVEYVSWARQSYASAKEWGTEFGWFPEHLGQAHAEVCCTTDMLEIALLLGRYVDRAYYADAERFGRNHLLESQWLSLEQITQAVRSLPKAETMDPRDDRYATYDDVIGRQVGGFSSRPAFNDKFHLGGTDLMQCCNASGARGLYDLWHYAVDVEQRGDDGLDAVSVHLRMSVENPLLRVVSHEPTSGRLGIRARRPCSVSVRLPDGVSQAVVVIRHGEQADARSLAADKGYVTFTLDEPMEADLHYALPERRAIYTIGDAGFTAHLTGCWRGETMISLDPVGSIQPLYMRAVDIPAVEPSPACDAGIDCI